VCDTGDEMDARLRRGLVNHLDGGFAEVVRTYGGLVYSAARGLSDRPADAEDLAAETFLRAYKALCSYDPSRLGSLAVRAWLVSILRNTARNQARDAARRPAPPPGFEPQGELAITTDPAEEAEGAESQRQLGAVLAQLPEAQRVSVVLRHVVGLSISDISAVLGTKDGTVKSHISRGLHRLRALLTDPAGAGGRAASNGRVDVTAMIDAAAQWVPASEGRKGR